MRKYPTKKLIEETKQLINLHLFLKHGVGLKEDPSLKDLKVILDVLKRTEKDCF